MTPRKPQNRRPPQNNQAGQNTLVPPATAPQPSDYESDAQFYYSDNQQGSNGPATVPPPTRTNEELNLSVLQRHNPSITSIVSLAPYAVVYIFSPTSQLWEKSGIEGSLFVCQLTPGHLGEGRYSVFVLNRRGLNNFDADLASGDDVELTEEYVILKIDGQADGQQATTARTSNEARIYGLWIFSEPAPSSTAETRAINAKIIKECAVHAGQSKKQAQERQATLGHDGAYDQEEEASVPMDRQVSLRELFGQQREQDDGWSVKAHSPGPRPDGSMPHYPPNDQGNFQGGNGWPGSQPAPTGQQPAGRDVLDSLFRKAGVAYQGGPGPVP
ncbi:hypothetical protein FQN54_007676 [Arachnomyces sp. PD_36]|nr:hypothetical protein FQN54_007676 [Arachnomyces sp. PD_36]